MAKPTRLTSSGVVSSHPVRGLRVIVTGGSAVGIVTLFNNGDGSGTTECTLKAPIGDSREFYLDRSWDVGVWATLAGTGVEAYFEPGE